MPPLECGGVVLVPESDKFGPVAEGRKVGPVTEGGKFGPVAESWKFGPVRGPAGGGDRMDVL